MPAVSRSASTYSQRQLQLGEQLGARRARPARRRARRPARRPPTPRPSAPARAPRRPPPRRRAARAGRPPASLLGAQLAAQVAQREVGEVEAALAGPGEVGGQRGVAGEPARLQPRPRSACSAALTSCAAFGTDGSASHSPSAASSSGRERGDVEVRAPAARPRRRPAARASSDGSPAASAMPVEVAAAGVPTTPWNASPTRRPSRACASSQARTAPGSSAPPSHLEAALGLGLGARAAWRTAARAAPGTPARRTAGARRRGPTGATARSSGAGVERRRRGPAR